MYSCRQTGGTIWRVGSGVWAAAADGGATRTGVQQSARSGLLAEHGGSDSEHLDGEGGDVHLIRRYGGMELVQRVSLDESIVGSVSGGPTLRAKDLGGVEEFMQTASRLGVR
ncbi:hypothetical protein, partial [Paraburkholderia ginsengiterrae]|uniref:hypothetical protein n=1 Tax=Paraburkholderia ginsengiterrae TaxID=1462993 RepID=UPI000AA2A56F